MNNTLKNILAVIVGLLIGSQANMGVVMLGSNIIPPAEGVDPTNFEWLKNATAKYFIFPFLAHAIGTLVGAFIATMIAATHKLKMALIIGVLFLCGGIAAATMIPAPTWFVVLDLALAYIPMAWLGFKFEERIFKRKVNNSL